MFKKIISIKNVGRFLNSTASGDVEMKRFSLIFAENGRGKSTLCAILRSLQSGDPSYINGRKTLRGMGLPTVDLLLDSGNAKFDGVNWSKTCPTLAIFDSTFISENVYSGDTVELGHRRNLYGVIVGQQGVKLMKRIKHLDADTRAKSTIIRERADALQKLVPEGMPIKFFYELKEDADIDTKIKAAEEELKVLEEADRIKKRDALSELTLPSLPSGIFSLLSRKLEGIANDAQIQVTSQIRAHAMHDDGEAWLSQGLDYTIDDTCPFCGQNLDGVKALIAAYRAYFGDAYKGLLDEVAAKSKVSIHDEHENEEKQGDNEQSDSRRQSGIIETRNSAT